MPLARLRISAAAAVLVLLVPLLAACGGSEPPPTPAPPPSPTISAGGPTVAPTQPAATTPPDQPTAQAAPTTGDVAPTTVPTQPVPADGILRTPYLEFGIAEHLYYTDRERVLTLTNNAGFDWVRQQVVWKDIEGPNPGNYAWGELDNIVNDVAAHNLKLLVSVVQSPTFYTADGSTGLPQDPASLGNFVAAMAERYGAKIGAYEIWNEQNLAHENGGRVTVDDAGHYVDILVESYNRIKAISPSSYVLAGPPSSTGFEREDTAVPDEKYYRAMYSYKGGIIKDHFDAQAVHPGGAANPPETFYPENPSFIQGCVPAPDNCWNNDPTHYFRHIEDVRRFMEDEGVGDHQIWITEFGWATKNNTPGYEFGNFISFDQQRDYILGAMKLVHDEYRYPEGQPWVGVMILWNMNFAVLWGAPDNPNRNPEHEQASFGILNPDWSPRPSFLGIQGYLAEVKKMR